MENEENIIQIENVEEDSNLENTEELEQTEENESSTGDDNEGLALDSNDNNDTSAYSTEITLTDSQYEAFIEHFTLTNNLLLIEVMFLFTIFLYLFLHFCLERRRV